MRIKSSQLRDTAIIYNDNGIIRMSHKDAKNTQVMVKIPLKHPTEGKKTH